MLSALAALAPGLLHPPIVKAIAAAPSSPMVMDLRIALPSLGQRMGTQSPIGPAGNCKGSSARPPPIAELYRLVVQEVRESSVPGATPRGASARGPDRRACNGDRAPRARGRGR